MGHALRAACKHCGGVDGRIEPTNGQNCVFCIGCGKHAYNAPKVETGEAVRHVSDRPEIKPSKRARIIARDGFKCLHCGIQAKDTIVHVGHLVAVKEGRDFGLTDAELFDDANLIALCEACNLGQGRRSYTPIEIHLLMVALKIAAKR